MTVNMAEHGL